MPNPEPNPENETHKVLWDFVITNRSPNFDQRIWPSDSRQRERERERGGEREREREREREPAELWTLSSWQTTRWNWKKGKRKISTWTLLGNRKTLEHGRDGNTTCNWYAWYSHKTIGKGSGGIENKGTSGDHLNYGTFKISQYIEKSLGDLSKFVLSVRLQWKTIS